MSLDILKFDSAQSLDLSLATEVKRIIDSAIEKKGEAIIAFSGGSTPKGMFIQLGGLDIDWAKVKVTLVDDRWVTEDHADSNAGFLKKYMIGVIAGDVKPEFVSLVDNADTKGAFESEVTMNEKLEAVLPQLDLAILGMGGDGHTASFFPGSPQLDASLDLANTQTCLATEPTNAEHDRMTLSLAYLFKSEQLILHFTGESKHAVFTQANDNGLDKALPISYALHQDEAPIAVYYAN